MNPSRRSFLKNAAIVGMGFTALRNLTGCEKPVSQLAARKDVDAKDIFRLPKGFECQIISRSGRPMSDGLVTPGAHDGMAAFDSGDGRIILVCNHELEAGARDSGPFGKNNELFKKIDDSLLYDAGSGKAPCLGGTTTLVYDPAARQVEREFLSLAGTTRNCAGGPTPWGSWITCEETTQLAEGNYERDHGFNFEVPARTKMELHKARALRGMGRFNHEAVAVSDRMIVYQTEDRGDGLIYRFIPDSRDRDRANLLKGGRLQALKLRDYRSFDTRNWRVQRIAPYQQWDVEWVDLEDIESLDDELRLQGFFQHGAARFARGEGMWYGRVDGGPPSIYFACTNGGKKKNGQVFRYTPSPREGDHDESREPGKLELYVEMDEGDICSLCDNLTISDRGDIYLGEDNSRANKRIIRVTPQRKIYTFAECIGYTSELAGLTFSPDFKTLFVNVQFPGITTAIHGDWDSLPT